MIETNNALVPVSHYQTSLADLIGEWQKRNPELLPYGRFLAILERELPSYPVREMLASGLFLLLQKVGGELGVGTPGETVLMRKVAPTLDRLLSGGFIICYQAEEAAAHAFISDVIPAITSAIAELPDGHAVTLQQIAQTPVAKFFAKLMKAAREFGKELDEIHNYLPSWYKSVLAECREKRESVINRGEPKHVGAPTPDTFLRVENWRAVIFFLCLDNHDDFKPHEIQSVLANLSLLCRKRLPSVGWRSTGNLVSLGERWFHTVILLSALGQKYRDYLSPAEYQQAWTKFIDLSPRQREQWFFNYMTYVVMGYARSMGGLLPEDRREMAKQFSGKVEFIRSLGATPDENVRQSVFIVAEPLDRGVEDQKRKARSVEKWKRLIGPSTEGDT